MPRAVVRAHPASGAPEKTRQKPQLKEPATAPTETFLPSRKTLATLRQAAAGCQGCRLYAPATQTVFGEGPESAQVVLLGEQPGDKEDRAGRPFVGPAGEVLARALETAGLVRDQVYVTNTVKHFHFEQRGKARLHKKPKPGDIRACRPWLDAELELIRPRALVLLGATAAQAVFGASFRITQQRGQPRSSPLSPFTLATWHPSNVLRAPDSAARKRLLEELSHDLTLVVDHLRSG